MAAKRLLRIGKMWLSKDQLTWFWQKIFQPFGTFAAGVVCGVDFHLPDRQAWTVRIIVGASVFVATVIVELYLRADKYDRNTLENFLFLFRDVLRLSSDSDVRFLLWLPHGDGEMLRAATRYVPELQRSSVDSLTKHQGIVGRAVRTQSFEFWQWPPGFTDADYRKSLVHDWNFEHVEAGARRGDRTAFVGIPLVKDGTVRAVIYLDSSDRLKLSRLSTSDRETIQRVAGLLHPLLSNMEAKP